MVWGSPAHQASFGSRGFSLPFRANRRGGFDSQGGPASKFEEDVMNHDFRLWICPVLVIVFGLLLFDRSKDKWATIGGYVFLCGFFIALWILTFGGLPGRL
jgi:hypothetical protein